MDPAPEWVAEVRPTGFPAKNSPEHRQAHPVDD